MTDLKGLFAGADAVGNKYQTPEERAAHRAKLDAVMGDIIREAIERGEYDQEKKIWLV
ncbi:MAG TPA: hypothetical protein VLL52_25880 [Anaerolineae bacterium]|nr:hypothetical protein [Anaerolineae bacterium]